MAIISGHGGCWGCHRRRRSLGLRGFASTASVLLLHHHCCASSLLSLMHSFGPNTGRRGSDNRGNGWRVFGGCWEFGRSHTAVQFCSHATISAVVVDLRMKATIMMIRLLLLLELLLLLQNHRTRAERRRPKNKAIIFSCKHLQRSSSTRNTHQRLKTAQRVFLGCRVNNVVYWNPKIHSWMTRMSYYSTRHSLKVPHCLFFC